MKTLAGGSDKSGGYTLSSGDTLGQYKIVRPLGKDEKRGQLHHLC